MSIKKADYILKGDKVIYPKMPDEGLELFYGIKGKTNQGIRKNVILDMSGNRRDGILTGFNFDVASGYANGLIFDLEDDTLTRPVIPGLDPNNLTFQVNANILRFNPDGTSQTVRDGLLTEIGRNLMKGSANFLLYSNNHALYPVQIENLGTHRRIRRDPDFATSPRPEFSIYSPYFVPTVVGEIYVQSLDVRPEKDVLIRMYYSDNVLCRAGVWTRLTSPAKAAVSESTRTFAFIIDKEFGPNFNPWIEYRNAKFERGEVATPWTPAPEDIIGSVAYRDNMLGDLEDVVDDMDINKISGERVVIEGMKDNHLDVTVEGNTVQHSDWYAKEGLSTQYQDTKVMGKNLANLDDASTLFRYAGGRDVNPHYSETYSISDGVITATGQNIGSNLMGFKIYINGSTNLYIKFNSNFGSSSTVYYMCYDINDVGISGQLTVRATKSGTLYSGVVPSSTIPSSTAYVRIGLGFTYLPDYSFSDIIISNIDTPFEPYKDSVKNGLVLEYNGKNFFNSPQTTSLKDRSGNGNHGTPVGFAYNNTSGSDGNGGIVFDGVDDGVTVVHNEGLNLPIFTYDIWLNINSSNVNQSIISKSDGGGAADVTQTIWYYGGRKILHLFVGNGITSTSISIDWTPYFNTTANVTCTYDGSTASMYVNGVLKVNKAMNVSIPMTTKPYYISSGLYKFKGVLYSVKVYNRALSDAEIYQNYMAGTNLNMPSPEDPSPVVSNLPAGTYKYTSTDGIYEFTLDEELRGIGTSVDRIVFDRTSKTGKLERRVKKEVYTGTETAWAVYADTQADVRGFHKSLTKGTGVAYCSHFLDEPSDIGYGGVLQVNREGMSALATYLKVAIDKTRLTTNDLAGVKEWIAGQYTAGTPLTLVYGLTSPTTTPLTFTKVPSSTKTEVPMTFFTATPSLEYPAQVWDAQGDAVSRGRNILSDDLFTSKAEKGLVIDGVGCYKVLGANFPLIEGFDFKKGSYSFSMIAKNANTTTNWPLVFVVYYSGGGYNYIMPVTTSDSQFKKYYFKSPPDRTIISVWSSYASVGSGAYIANDSLLCYEGDIPLNELPDCDPGRKASLPFPVLRRIGTVADTYNPTTGEYVKRISDWVTLDGAKSWLFHGADSLRGSKLFYIGLLGGVNGKSLTFDYQTKPLSNSGSVLANENVAVLSTNYNVLYVRPTNIDTGFSDALSPSGPEIKAYFYGWKMCNADGTSPYYKSEVPYTPSTWAEWNYQVNLVTKTSSGVELTSTDSGWSVLRMDQRSFKDNTNYGFLYNVVTPIISDIFFVDNTGCAFPKTKLSGSTTPGNKKYIIRSLSPIVTNGLGFCTDRTTQYAGSTIKIKDIRIFELPPGSQIEDDFTYLTADQLAAKYTFNGLCQKHWKKVTDGTGLTNVLPTKSYEGYTPYKMIYQLATPVIEKLPRNLIKAYYPTTVLETDSPSYCKPTLNTTVKSLDYLKETRTVNNILIWNRALGDEELISQNKLFHERYHIRSDTYNGIPINEYLNLNGGIPMNTTLALDITMTI